MSRRREVRANARVLHQLAWGANGLVPAYFARPASHNHRFAWTTKQTPWRAVVCAPCLRIHRPRHSATLCGYSFCSGSLHLALATPNGDLVPGEPLAGAA